MAPVKFRVVVTANRRLWETYGRRAAESFLDYWPVYSDAQLILYAEDFDPEQRFQAATVDGRVIIRPMPAWHTAWKARHETDKRAHGIGYPGRAYDFRQDCVRFSHKVAALTDAAQKSPRDGIMIMMDADVVAHRAVSPDWLAMLLPAGRYMAWLDRRAWYPECGFVLFREVHEAHQLLMMRLRATYEHDSVFSMAQTHDSWVLMTLVKQMVAKGQMPAPFNLSRPGGNRGHPFVESILGERLDHLKGKRKDGERSPEAKVHT